jgi:hypothetical protein
MTILPPDLWEYVMSIRWADEETTRHEIRREKLRGKKTAHLEARLKKLEAGLPVLDKCQRCDVPQLQHEDTLAVCCGVCSFCELLFEGWENPPCCATRGTEGTVSR